MKLNTSIYLFLILSVSCSLPSKNPNQYSNSKAITYGAPSDDESQVQKYSDLLEDLEQDFSDPNTIKGKNFSFALEIHKDIKRLYANCTLEERNDVLELLKRSSALIKIITESNNLSIKEFSLNHDFFDHSIKKIVEDAKNSGTLFLSVNKNVEFAMDIFEHIDALLKIANLAHQDKYEEFKNRYYLAFLEEIISNSQYLSPQFCLLIIIQLIKPNLEKIRFSLAMEQLNKEIDPRYKSSNLNHLERTIRIYSSLFSLPDGLDKNYALDPEVDTEPYLKVLYKNKNLLKSIIDGSTSTFREDPTSYVSLQFQFISSSLNQLYSSLNSFSRPLLTAHLSYDRLKIALMNLKDYLRKSEQLLNEYHQRKKEASQSAVNALMVQIDSQKLQTEDLFLRNEVDVSNDVFESLQTETEIHENNLLTFHTQFLSHFSDRNWLDNHGKALSVRRQETLSLSTKDGVENPSRNVLDIAVKSNKEPIKISLSAYQSLAINIQNNWKANGLIIKHMTTDLNLATLTGDIDLIEFGPEGFTQSKSHNFSSYKVSDHTKSTYSRSESAESVALTGKAGVSAGGGGDGGAAAGGGLKPSASLEGSYTKSQTNASGSEDRKSYSVGTRSDSSIHYFIPGLRLPDAPIPTLPVGSLVKVILPKGKTHLDDALSVDIVHRDDIYLAPMDCDVYFVVNDDGKGHSSSLIAHLKIYETVNDQLKEFQKKLLEVLNFLRNHKLSVLSSGFFPLNQATALKQEAFSQLSLLPAFAHSGVQQFAQMWIEKEISSLENYSRLNNAQKNLNYARSKRDVFQANQALQSDINSIKKTLLIEDLKQFDSARLLNSLLKLIRHQTDSVLPVIKMLNPEVLDHLNSRTASLYFDYRLPLTTQAQFLIDWSQTLIDTLDHIENEQNMEFKQTVALKFPLYEGAFSEADWNTAPEWISSQMWQAVWNSLNGSGSSSFQFTLTPEMLCGGPSGISNDIAFPVITKMGFGVVGKDSKNKSIEIFNNDRLRLDVQRGPHFVMLNLEKNSHMPYLKPKISKIGLPIVLGSSTDAMSFVEAILPQSSAQGESPFTTYSFDFLKFSQSQTFRTAIQKAEALVLFFEIMGKSN